MASVLITGGGGFIGSWLSCALVKKGWHVRILDNFDPQAHPSGPNGLPEDIELVYGDIRDPQTIARALQGIDYVVHFAAVVGVGQSMYEINRYCDVNVMGTTVLLEALSKVRGIQKLVVASSMSIYGEGAYCCPNCGPTLAERREQDLRRGIWEPRCSCGAQLIPVPTPETKLPQPASVYAVTKYTQEKLCLVVGQSYGIPTLALRFFNVYGPGQSLQNPYTGVVAIFASRLLAGEAPLIFEDGMQTRDFIHVLDVVNACIRALESDAAGIALNIGIGCPISVLQLAEKLRSILGGPEPCVLNRYRVGDIRHCVADVSRAEQVLGWKASISLDEGLRDLVAWFRDQEGDRISIQRALAELERRGLLW